MGKGATDLRSLGKNLVLFFLYNVSKIESPNNSFDNIRKYLKFLFQLIGLRMFFKKVSTFFTNLVKETIRIREEQNIVRPDNDTSPNGS